MGDCFRKLRCRVLVFRASRLADLSTQGFDCAADAVCKEPITSL